MSKGQGRASQTLRQAQGDSILFIVFFLFFLFLSPATHARTLPPKSLYDKLTPLVLPLLTDSDIDSAGVQIGIVSPQYTGTFAWGSLSHVTQMEPSPTTIYEIASLTKPFVATLVNRAIVEGKIKLEAPVATCGSGETSALCFKGKPVTWLDLLTHHASLPHLPDNLDWNGWQPTREYSREQLNGFMASYRLNTSPGQRFDYSSLGYAVLGLGLEKLYGKTLTQLLEGLTADLGMHDTRVDLSSEQMQRTIHGYIHRQPVPYGEQREGLVGSSGLKSTANDLLIWLQHQLALKRSPWSPAIAHSHTVTPRPGAPLCNMALGWLHFNLSRWYWHSGSAPGFKSFLAFDPAHKTGVVILMNSRVIGFKMEPVGIRIMNLLKEVGSL